ncbi:unnamed protein product [Caenorhabditis brenneri]
MSSTFPLFRLPLVALQVVINRLHLNHLVILSFCSQRAQRILRLLRKKNRKTCIEAKCNSITSVVLKDTFLEDLLPDWSSEVIDRVETSRVNIIEKSQISENDRIEFVRVGESVIPLTKTFQKDGEEAILNLYFEERFEGLKVMLDHFTWFFDTPIHRSCHNSRLHQNQIRFFLDYAVAKQKSIDYCHIHSENTTEEEIRRALDVCNVVNNFFIKVYPNPQFQHPLTFERDSFAVMNGFWFNLDNLLNINCRVCRIWGSKLTSLQMNQYLKRWKSGGYEKTRRISIEMEDINLGVLLSGLNAVNFPQGEKRTYKDENNRTVTIEYGFDIHKNDNTVATIVHHGGNIVSNLFHMIVW